MKSLNLRMKAPSSQSQLVLLDVTGKQSQKQKHHSTRSELTKYRPQIKIPTAVLSSKSKGASTSRFQKSISIKTKRSQLVYNKWFIHPSKRMKHAQSPSKNNIQDLDYYYKGLYQERYADTTSPFRWQISEKMRLVELLPKNDFQCLEEFKKNQLRKKRRVPEIVQMLTKKHRVKTQL